MAVTAARAASAKKARDVLILDMREVFILTDFFVICSGNTDRQVAAIQEAVEERLAALGVRPVRREGVRHKRWVLLDYLDIVVHIFRQEEREYYEIERLWKDAPVLEWEEKDDRAATGI
ncbi:MAG: ribosome silencing factor [Actinobacteria bacterium]|nr:ribosome silencing factor [Actinomycetota bacterium]